METFKLGIMVLIISWLEGLSAHRIISRYSDSQNADERIQQFISRASFQEVLQVRGHGLMATFMFQLAMLVWLLPRF